MEDHAPLNNAVFFNSCGMVLHYELTLLGWNYYHYSLLLALLLTLFIVDKRVELSLFIVDNIS